MEATLHFIADLFGVGALFILIAAIIIVLVVAFVNGDHIEAFVIALDAKIYDLHLWSKGYRRYHWKCSVCKNVYNDFGIRSKNRDCDVICTTCFSGMCFDAPCDLCGVTKRFYNSAGNPSDTLNICKACTSNPEGFDIDWFPPRNSNIDRSHQDLSN